MSQLEDQPFNFFLISLLAYRKMFTDENYPSSYFPWTSAIQTLGAEISSNTCPRSLSVPRSEQFSKSVARGKLWALRNDVQGQISEDIFAPDGGYCVYYPSHIFFRNTRRLESWGISLAYFLGLVGAYLASRLNQSRVSENIWWIILKSSVLMPLNTIFLRPWTMGKHGQTN